MRIKKIPPQRILLITWLIVAVSSTPVGPFLKNLLFETPQIANQKSVTTTYDPTPTVASTPYLTPTSNLYLYEVVKGTTYSSIADQIERAAKKKGISVPSQAMITKELMDCNGDTYETAKKLRIGRFLDLGNYGLILYD